LIKYKQLDQTLISVLLFKYSPLRFIKSICSPSFRIYGNHKTLHLMAIRVSSCEPHIMCILIHYT